MDAFQLIAERRITEAMQNGKFDHLAGRGKPLPKDADPNVPVELHMAYKILKNAGCLPPEAELRKQIDNIAELLEADREKGVSDSPEREDRIRRVRFLMEKLNRLHRLPAELEKKYFDDIVARIG